MLLRLYRYLSLRPYWIALLIAGLLLLWMLSKPTSQASTEQPQPDAEQTILPKVQITRFTPEKMTKYLTLYGRSEAHSHALLRTKIAGEVVAINADKGNYVNAASPIAVIEQGILPQQLAQADALYAERLLNYNAVKSLNNKGLQGRASLAEANSLLLAAATTIKQLQLQLQYTQIVAPFAGVLQTQLAQRGDYLQIGDPIFRLESIDPIIIRGDTTEHFIDQLKLGEAVSATLLSGETITGNISYIAALADPQSSTFRVEAEFANPDFKIASGVSAKLSIPLAQVDAIYVSPSTLAMDAQGNLGIKSVRDQRVVFKQIDLVEADNDGVWLAGFSSPVDIITLGQGFVNPGDPVDPIAAEN